MPSHWTGRPVGWSGGAAATHRTRFPTASATSVATPIAPEADAAASRRAVLTARGWLICRVSSTQVAPRDGPSLVGGFGCALCSAHGVSMAQVRADVQTDCARCEN
jgi:hypothetical protein